MTDKIEDVIFFNTKTGEEEFRLSSVVGSFESKPPKEEDMFYFVKEISQETIIIEHNFNPIQLEVLSDSFSEEEFNRLYIGQKLNIELT